MMSERESARRAAMPASAFQPTSRQRAERRCACGGIVGPEGECATCRARRLQAEQTTHGAPQPAMSQQSQAVSRVGHQFGKLRVQPASVATRGRAVSRSHQGGGDGDPTTETAPPATTTSETTATATESSTTTTPEAATTETAETGTTGAPATPTLRWTHLLRSPNDALWYFCGERPRWFSTTARLMAMGFADPTQLTWHITAGSNKVAFDGPATGEEVLVRSTAGSARLNDVTIEVREGTGPGAISYSGTLTVRKPHRLIQRFTRDNAACPAWVSCSAGCTAFWTEIGYRVVDNVGGTIVGATVNEHFPGTKTNDQPNDWLSPAAFSTVPVWPNTNGTFIDNWFQSCGSPAPVAPTAANANTSVDRMTHEFYVGSETPGRGCRVQRHTAHRYLGFARHENITTPAP
jgi:hypothetical protein